MDCSIPRVLVAPMYIPSQMKAAMPATGMVSAQTR